MLSFRWDKADVANVHETIAYLLKHTPRVLLIGSAPIIDRFGDKNMAEYLSFLGVQPQPGKQHYLPQYLEANDARLPKKIAAQYERVDLVTVEDLYQGEGGVLVLDGLDVLYVDDDHLTTFGANRALHRLDKAISDIFDYFTERLTEKPPAWYLFGLDAEPYSTNTNPVTVAVF